MSATARWLLGTTAVGLVVAGGLAFWLWPVLAMLGDPERINHTYYIPAESMLPTLEVGDRVRPLRPVSARLTRGAIVVFEGIGSARVARIVGVGGDTIAMRAGRLSINGRPAKLDRAGAGPRLSDGASTQILYERLPGEAGRHRVLDAGESPGDDVPAAQIPAGHVYVLGDNRDRAADSRYPRDQMGVGFVPATDIIGVVDRLLWSASFGQRGRTIDGPVHPDPLTKGTP